MAARVRQTWRAMDGFQRYMAVSGAAGAAAGVATGVAGVLDGERADHSAVMGVYVGVVTTVAWPAMATVGALYVPLKALEAVRGN